jgi:hypothetical protein
MTFWEIIDPWTALRREKAANEYLLKECERLEQECRNAQREAIGAAAEYFMRKHEMLERTNQAMREQLTQIASMTPLTGRGIIYGQQNGDSK